MDLLRQTLKHHEGLRLEAYKDTKGLWTIGIGHLLDQEQHDDELEVLGLEDELDDWEGFTITEEQAYALLELDIEDAVEDLAPAFTPEDIEALDEPRRVVLISMAFQLGGGGVRKFKSFIKHLKAGEYSKAADEMLWSNGETKNRRSKWYRDTQKRCEEAAEIMRGESHNTLTASQERTLIDMTNEALVAEIKKFNDELARRLLGG